MDGLGEDNKDEDREDCEEKTTHIVLCSVQCIRD